VKPGVKPGAEEATPLSSQCDPTGTCDDL
jgi:hypothetical protein